MVLRVALTVNNDHDIWMWRRPLVRALLAADVEVAVIAPTSDAARLLVQAGCRVLHWPLRRGSLRPWSELVALVSLYQLYRAWSPTIAHHFTIKPNLYGTLAAKKAGVPVCIASVTGLGYLWSESTLAVRSLRPAVTALYARVLAATDATVFLNQDDRRLLRGGRTSLVVPGEGVDLDALHPEAVPLQVKLRLRQALGIADGVPVILMAGRMLRHKGVGEFVEAAIAVRQRWPEAEFLLVGPVDKANPAHIEPARLRSWEAEGAVRYLGWRSDMLELLSVADVVVLPTYYREGIPRVLVEAAAMAKPIVATDVPGCREVVQHGVNGLLVPPRDAAALAEAIGRLLDSPDLRARLGAQGRQIAEARFSDRRVVADLLALYAGLLASKGLPVPPGLDRYASPVE